MAVAATAVGVGVRAGVAEKPKRRLTEFPLKHRDITELSFVNDYWVLPMGRKRRESFRVFWNVVPSGDYGADCDEGNRMAEEFLTFLCDDYDWNGFPGWSILGWIASDMPSELRGLEVGFLSLIGKMALVGQYIAAERAPRTEWRNGEVG